MNRRWLLDVGIGPVGRFIAAGRRSRDLWWGSTWVSECARQTALWLHETGGAELLVPSWNRVFEVGKKSFLDPLTYAGRVSNRLRAVVAAADGGEVAELVQAAEGEARRILEELILKSVRVLHRPGDRLRDLDPREVERKTRRIRGWLDEVIDEEAFRTQLEALRKTDDFLEFFAVWTPFDSGEPFGPAYRRADALLTARKQVRIFSAPAWTRPGRRKSDLDAGRESVLKSPPELAWPKPRSGEGYRARQRLGIGPDEGLDALGLARRVAALTRGPMLLPLPFPPLGRVAADPWLAAVAADENCRKAFTALKSTLEEEKKDPERSLFFSWCSPSKDPGEPVGDREIGEGLFRFDASILFEGGLEGEEKKLERLAKKGAAREADVQRALGVLAALREPIRDLQRRCGMPPPYYALLQMDGDGVGQALGKLASEEELERCVRALERFADGAETILRDNHGCAFYVGGDDLAAYLPVDKAVKAAREVAASFAEEVGSVFEELGYGKMTLSGGLVLAHVRADLRAVRRLAGKALAAAKKGRHESRLRGETTGGEAWLEVRDVPRSGVARSCRGPLEELASNLERWRSLLAEGRLSLRTAQELLELAERFADERASDGGRLGLELAVARVAAQQRRSTSETSKALPESLVGVESWREVRLRAAELLVARRLQSAHKLRPPTPPEEAEEEAS